MYDTNHVYLTFGGTSPGPEIWQTGCRFAPHDQGGPGSPSPFTTGQFNDWSLNDVADDIAAWWQNASMRFPADHALTWVKAALIGTDGEYETEPRIYQFAGAGRYGMPTTDEYPLVPLQCALVVSLRSGQTLGAANYGRMYLPHPSWSRELGQRTSRGAR